MFQLLYLYQQFGKLLLEVCYTLVNLTRQVFWQLSDRCLPLRLKMLNALEAHLVPLTVLADLSLGDEPGLLADELIREHFVVIKDLNFA